MWLLAVDSSSKDAGVALLRDDRLVALSASRSGERHSVLLFRCVEDVLREAAITLADIDVYAVATGPGGFTGLRVGLALVKSFAEMHDRPVVPVSTLEAVAEAAAAEGFLIPVVDAYRGQAFAAVYEKKNGELSLRGQECAMDLPVFLAQLETSGFSPDECTLVTPHLEKWQQALDATSFRAVRCEKISPVLAEPVAQRARRKFASGEQVDALHLQASYIRRSDAELLWRRK